MLNPAHKLSEYDADQIKQALLRSLAPVTSPVDIAEPLIRAFALVDSAAAAAEPRREGEISPNQEAGADIGRYFFTGSGTPYHVANLEGCQRPELGRFHCANCARLFAEAQATALQSTDEGSASAMSSAAHPDQEQT